MAKAQTPSFILNIKLYANTVEQIQLHNIFEQCRSLYNYMLNETFKRYRTMDQSKKYQKNKRCLKVVLKKFYSVEEKIAKETDKKKLSVLKKELSFLKKEKTKLFKEQQDIMMSFGYNEYVLHEVVKKPKYYFNRIDINTAQTLATRAFKAVEKIRLGKAKNVRFVRFNEMTSIEGKSNASGIIFKFENNQPVLKIQGMKINVKIYENDIYVQEALKNNRVKYCRIVKETVRGKEKYTLQLIMEGVPPLKKRALGNGKVGIDPSLQHMAIASNQKVMLVSLTEKLQAIEDELRRKQRKLDRSRRSTNPKKFNKDGTFNLANKDKWIRSNNYQKTLSEIKELHRKQRVLRKLQHECLVNEVLQLGDIFHIEKNNFKAFQNKKKKTTKKKGRYQSKKRFGKSIAKGAPSMFLSILERKVKLLGGEIYFINPKVCKPSQYDHKLNDFVKKKLSDRWHVFSDGETVQRDCYSAFLIQQADGITSKIHQMNCLAHYDAFKKMHDVTINQLELSKNKMSIM